MMAMRRAVQLCGGIDALGDALNVHGEILKKWISGEEEVPLPAFTQCVGLLLEATARSPRGGATPEPSDGGRKEPRH
jgi:hypothetical protein